MSEQNQGSSTFNQLSLARRLDQICDRFEQLWFSGQRPKLELYLIKVPASEREMLLAELLPMELECRLQRGEQPTLAEYRRRLPAYVDVIEKLVGPLPGSGGPDPNPSEPPALPPEESGPPEESAPPPQTQPSKSISELDTKITENADASPLERTVPYGGRPSQPPGVENPQSNPESFASCQQPDGPSLEDTVFSTTGAEDPPTDAEVPRDKLDQRSSLSDRFFFAAGFDYRRTPDFTDYQLLDQIGKGAMGVVYRAIHLPSRRMVAVKLIRIDLLNLTPEGAQVAIERFRLEARSGALLEHEHIIDVYEVGQSARQYFYSMNYVDGPSLFEVVQNAPLESRLAARILYGVAAAIAHAHAFGILHRDLKPQNILLDSKWRPYVADFGLAKTLGSSQRLTHEGDMLGTPGYMAPEQVADASEVDEAGDIYGLGATLFHVLTQRPPFTGDTTLSIIQQVLGTPPVSPQQLNPNVEPQLADICLRCLAKDPAERFESAEALANALAEMAGIEEEF